MDSSFRAVMTTDRTLFIEISDDRFVGPSADWVNEDHLEIWLSNEEGPESGKCFEKDHTPDLVQYGIRLIDGTVFPAFGHPKEPLMVERAEDTDADDKPVVRLKIKLPEFKAITVVYSDSDDGKAQKRLIATSPLKFGKRLTLGGVYEINPKDATCAVKDGKLEPVMTPKVYKWDEPVIGAE